MTPAQLYAALDARRRELGLAWWQVAVALDVNQVSIRQMHHGLHCQAVTERAPQWLERRPVPPRTE